MHSKPICNAEEGDDIDVIESPPNSEFSTEHLRGSVDCILVVEMSYLDRCIVRISIYREPESKCLYCNLGERVNSRLHESCTKLEPLSANRHGTNIYIHHQTLLQLHTDHRLWRCRV